MASGGVLPLGDPLNMQIQMLSPAAPKEKIGILKLAENTPGPEVIVKSDQSIIGSTADGDRSDHTVGAPAFRTPRPMCIDAVGPPHPEICPARTQMLLTLGSP